MGVPFPTLRIVQDGKIATPAQISLMERSDLSSDRKARRTSPIQSRNEWNRLHRNLGRFCSIHMGLRPICQRQGLLTLVRLARVTEYFRQTQRRIAKFDRQRSLHSGGRGFLRQALPFSHSYARSTMSAGLGAAKGRVITRYLPFPLHVLAPLCHRSHVAADVPYNREEF